MDENKAGIDKKNSDADQNLIDKDLTLLEEDFSLADENNDLPVSNSFEGKKENTEEEAKDNKDDLSKKASNIFEYSMNRELSWLNFNKRVLYESLDDLTPDYESLKFVAIFNSNLEEFFRVRVGSLTDLSYVAEAKPDNKTGLTAKEQLKAIFEKTSVLLEEKDEVYNKVCADLEKNGIYDLAYKDLSKKEKKLIVNYYHDFIEPVLSPQIIDSHHPFPFIENNKLYIMLEMEEAGEKKYGLVQVPDMLKRYIMVDREKIAFIRIENIIEALIPNTFANYNVTQTYIFNVFRNADINIEDYLSDDDQDYKSEDYKSFMKIILKKRTRLQAVALCSNKPLSKNLKKFLSTNLAIEENQFFVTTSPLIMGYVFGLEDTVEEKNLNNLLYEPFTPQHNTMLNKNKPVIEQLLKKDILFIYPFEDIGEFIQLLDEAAEDPRVMSFKITIYRLARNSKIIRALLKALDNGKKVTVLMELLARFDEESNINYSETLLEAGANIIYGVGGYKIHSKVCQITMNINGEIKHITQIGTGNYNEKTSRQYTDLSLITSNEAIGLDAVNLFKNLNIGNVNGNYSTLLVSPTGFKPRIMELIDEEIKKGENGRIFFKFNSFTDKDIIIKLSEASMAGVKVKLIIRGISCMRPGVKGFTDNIEIRSIVGRYLEHPRVYTFGEGNALKIFIGSADLMTRNTEKRVEVTTPIYDSLAKKKIMNYLEGQWNDNTKARKMDVFGEYEKIDRAEDEPIRISQQMMMEKAIENNSSVYEEEIIDIIEENKKVGFLQRILNFFRGK